MPSWTPDDIALINEINQEAHELITSASRALDRLDTDPTLLDIFRRNIKAVLKAVHKRWKGKSHGRYVPFSDDDAAAVSRCARWPECP